MSEMRGSKRVCCAADRRPRPWRPNPPRVWAWMMRGVGTSGGQGRDGKGRRGRGGGCGCVVFCPSSAINEDGADLSTSASVSLEKPRLLRANRPNQTNKSSHLDFAFFSASASAFCLLPIPPWAGADYAYTVVLVFVLLCDSVSGYPHRFAGSSTRIIPSY